MARKKNKGNDRAPLSSTPTGRSPTVRQLPLTRELDYASDVDTDFLSETRVNLSPTNLAETLGPMVADKLAYPADAKTILTQQLGLYFQAIR